MAPPLSFFTVLFPSTQMITRHTFQTADLAAKIVDMVREIMPIAGWGIKAARLGCP
jgi:hypothetical protein